MNPGAVAEKCGDGGQKDDEPSQPNAHAGPSFTRGIRTVRARTALAYYGQAPLPKHQSRHVDDPAEVGKRLKAARVASGLTQRDSGANSRICSANCWMRSRVAASISIPTKIRIAHSTMDSRDQLSPQHIERLL